MSSVVVATVFLVVEGALVVLLKEVNPRAPISVVYALLMGAALLANFVVGVEASRRAATGRRREAELAAELAQLMLRADDLHSGMERAGRRLAEELKLAFASLELQEVAGDDRCWAIPLRNGSGVVGTLLVPANLPKSTQQRLQQRVVPPLTASLAAARDRDAINSALRASHDRLALLAEQQKALRRVATLVACGFSLAEVFSAVAQEMVRCLHVDDAEILRYTTDGATVVVACDSELPGPYFSIGERLTLEGDNVPARVLRTLRTARIDTHRNPAGPLATRMRNLGLHSRVGVPIVVDGRVWGVAVVGSALPEPLPADIEERMSDFADLVATAIINATTREELIASRARIVAAGDAARRRLERDLHDGAQQRLVSLQLQLRLAENLTLPEQTALRKQLSDMTAEFASVSKDLQEISRGIHPAILSKGGLGPALKDVARRAAVPVSVEVAIERRLPEHAEVAAYYAVTEAITNAAKHARASHVAVRADTAESSLRLWIDDDGIGGADPSRGSGLTGLKDRVEALGGHLNIRSPAGRGTSLQITLPLQDNDQSSHAGAGHLGDSVADGVDRHT